MFSIVETTIDIQAASAEVRDTSCGGYVSFEGWVRNHNDGKQVSALSYQAYEAMAVKEGQKIIQEAYDKFEVEKIVAIHRVGDLQLGDCAVYIGVSAHHRGPAYDASRYVIDNIKFRVPIWKKEHYVDGPSDWVACHHCAEAMKEHIEGTCTHHHH